ncbi:phage holin, LLH family [Lactobacillus crispatus]|uniref:phage holin, LLH family n=1 Tax=Lactobacillus crispatus TaxID=47770 RepID=UPI001F09448C|nr:phage holin, LLH family [Lactobacillus crispatus]MCT7688021.1 phage holin, LLH family [Lactobacillus crispatus]
MNLSQLNEYLFVGFLVFVAICQGVSTGIDFFASKSKKPLPKEVMTIDQIAKFVVSEAATLDISGAEKKAKAVEALLNQAQKENKPLTESVAKGAVQHAYDQMQADQEKATQDEDDNAQPIGFVSGDDSDDKD